MKKAKNKPAKKSAVEEYYDRNTRRFLKYGRGGEALAIHRELWGPGVTSRQEAIVYVNRLVLEQLNKHLGPAADHHIVDLGCGAGGTIFWLSQRRNDRYTGVTISGAQVELAEHHAERISANNCRFVKADFTNLPDIGKIDAAFAIESFLHAPDASSFFRGIAPALNPGGFLIICDDFLAEKSKGRTSRYWANRFKQGWHANNLITVEQAAEKAREEGFQLIEAINLSAYIRPYYPKFILFLLQWLTHLPIKSPFWANLSGGTALQVCLKNRWIDYEMLVFLKS